MVVSEVDRAEENAGHGQTTQWILRVDQKGNPFQRIILDGPAAATLPIMTIDRDANIYSSSTENGLRIVKWTPER